jgi:uncharacterized HAD superfamily protein
MVRIGVDIDEVLSQTFQALLDFYNFKYDARYTLDQVNVYSFQKVFGINAKEEKQLHADFFTTKFSKNLKTVPGSVEAINKLAKNNKLYAISSRPKWQQQQTEHWLSVYYGNNFKQIVLTDSHFNKTSTKSSVCVDMKLDYFVEDAVVYAEDCANVCKKVFLLNRPWNNEKISNKNIIRVDNWRAIVDYVNT